MATREPTQTMADAVAVYRVAMERLARLSVRQVSQRFPQATEVISDPRVLFLAHLETGRSVARAELNALVRVLTEVLGVDMEVWLGYLTEEVGEELKALEKELGVTGWTEEGDPVTE